jgi:hypothetical protein
MCSVFSRRESAYVRIISNGVIAWVQRLEIPGPAVNNSRLPSSKTHQQKVVIVIESLGVMVLHKVSNISARLAPSAIISNAWSAVVGKARPVLLQKRKLKRRPGTVIGHGPKPSAVVLNNRAADR